MTLKNRFFISCLLLLGLCLLASAEVSEEDAAVKADLDGDGKSELAFTYYIALEKIGLIILKWDGVKYMKQWEWEYKSEILE